MAILLIGLNHRTTPVELREKLYLSNDKLYPVLTELKQQSPTIEETAIVSTCNRFEIYAVVRDVVAAEQEILDYICQYYHLSKAELKTYLYIQQEQFAVRHLMRVTSGLDSMILGEAQILGQVNSAFNCATSVSTTGTLLHRLFEQALHSGKRARTETAISQHTTSVSHAAALLVNNRLQIENPYVVVVGAGEMAELAAQATQNHNVNRIAVLNRTYEHGVTLAEKIGGTAFSWSRLWDLLAEADVVISATGAPHWVLYAEDMQRVMQQRKGKPLVMVDVAVPRDIDPDAGKIDGITLYDIDDMQQVVDDSLAHRESCIPSVEAIIDKESQKYWHWLNERNVVPVIKEMRAEVSSLVDAELHVALQKLEHLSDYEQDVVKRMAHRIMNKILHAPTTSLREHAANGDGDDYADVVRDLFDLSNDDDHNRLYA